MKPLRLLWGVALMALLSVAASVAFAQADRAITIRMIDVKTGRMIATTDFLVRLDHQQTEHADWVTQNDDGSGKLSIPAEAKLILIQGKYDNSMSIYVNCDSEIKGKIPTLDTQSEERWYSVADILSAGIVTHNGCGKIKGNASFAPKPGEFVFFVRKRNWHESD